MLDLAVPAEVIEPITKEEIIEDDELALAKGQRVWLLPGGIAQWTAEVITLDARRGFAPLSFVKEVELYR